MNLDKIREIAREKMGGSKAHIRREKGFIYFHGLRTAKLAINLRKLIFPKDTADDKVIFTGALFHDIGKSMDSHNEIGSILVKRFLKDECSKTELKRVSDIVKYHNRRKDKKDYPDEVKLVQDADTLDHMGAMEIWISFMYCAYEDESIDYLLQFQEGPFWKESVEKMRAYLNYKASKEIFDEKLAFVQGFYNRLRRENEGEIWT